MRAARAAQVRILEDKAGVVLHGLEEVHVKSASDIFQLLDQVLRDSLNVMSQIRGGQGGPPLQALPGWAWDAGAGLRRGL